MPQATGTNKTDSIEDQVERLVNARLAEIEARAKKDAEAKAEAEAEKPKEPDPNDEYVTIQLFKDSRDYKDDVFVSVNGEACLIKRGEPVKIRKKFALVLEESERQNGRAAKYQEEQQEIAKAAEAAGRI
jgi:hypothetical protein